MNHRGNILHPGSVPWRAHPCPALLPRTMIERRRGGSQSEMTKRRAILGRKNSSRSPHDIVGALVCWARSSVDARADATTSFVHDGFHHHTKLHETREQHRGKDTQRRTCNEDETRRVADYYTRRRKGIEERASLGEMGWVSVPRGQRRRRGFPCLWTEEQRGTDLEDRGRNTVDRWTVQSRESGYRADVITAAARDQSRFADLFLPLSVSLIQWRLPSALGLLVTLAFLGVSLFGGRWS